MSTNCESYDDVRFRWFVFRGRLGDLRKVFLTLREYVSEKKESRLSSLVVTVTRVGARIAARASIAHGTRLRAVDRLGLAARHVAHSRRLREISRVCTAWGARALRALVGTSGGGAWVASRASSILTAAAAGTTARPTNRAKEKRRLVVVVADLLFRRLQSYSRLRRPRGTLDLGRAEVPDDRLGCDDLRKTFLITWWRCMF